MDDIITQLKNAGYSYSIAIATQGEIKAGAACGQLSLIVEKEKIRQRNMSKDDRSNSSKQ